jgi:hypothetical protein
MKNASKLTIKVPCVKLRGRRTTAVKFTASAKRGGQVRCVPKSIGADMTIRVFQAQVGNKIEYRAELVNYLDDGYVSARTPSKAFASAVRSWW